MKYMIGENICRMVNAQDAEVKL